jgi:hypothetical protein
VRLNHASHDKLRLLDEHRTDKIHNRVVGPDVMAVRGWEGRSPADLSAQAQEQGDC